MALANPNQYENPGGFANAIKLLQYATYTHRPGSTRRHLQPIPGGSRIFARKCRCKRELRLGLRPLYEGAD